MEALPNSRRLRIEVERHKFLGNPKGISSTEGAWLCSRHLAIPSDQPQASSRSAAHSPHPCHTWKMLGQPRKTCGFGCVLSVYEYYNMRNIESEREQELLHSQVLGILDPVIGIVKDHNLASADSTERHACRYVNQGHNPGQNLRN